MKVLRFALLSLVAVASVAVVAYALRASRRNAATGDASVATTAAASAVEASPADARIRAGESKIKLMPERADGYNLLAAALMQKARETGDMNFNRQAQSALERSFQVAPDNYDATKLQGKLLLTFHRFADALAVAERAQRLRPQDHDNYGALVDANVELGNYEAAVAAAQRMVDLRPDAASYSRVAYLRSLHGDTEGAIEAMRVAVQASDPRDPEAVAWARVQLGDELDRAGRRDEAEREYDKALAVFPSHGLALDAKARARLAAGDYDAAVAIYSRDDSHDALLALGDIYARLGRREEARQKYAAFEEAERVAAAEENDMSHLARFWADREQNLDEAVRLMQQERARRADIYTCDALAWTLFKSGRLTEAKAAIDDALRLGTRDARIHYHAGMIYQRLGDPTRATRHLKLSLEINPFFDLLQAEAARRTLASINA